MALAEETAQASPTAPARTGRPTWLGHPATADGVRATASVSDAPSRPTTRGRDAFYRRGLAVADVVAIVLALTLAAGLVGPGVTVTGLALSAVLVVALSKLLGLYDRDELVLAKTTLEETPAILNLATMATLLVWLFDGVALAAALGKSDAVLLWVLIVLLTLGGRASARAIAGAVTHPERCLVVGDPAAMRTISRKLEEAQGVHATLVASLPYAFEREHAAELRVLEHTVRELDVDRVILAPGTADSDAMLDMVRLVKSLGVKVSVLPRMFEVVGSSVVFDDLSGITVLGVRRFGLSRSSAAVKRVVDVLGAGFGLVAIAPLLALIALAVRLDSRGPIFFRQVRVGRDSRRFSMLKFRTMVDGADAMKDALRCDNQTDGGLFKIADDPRTTRMGRLLRRTSLDELPQLINVLRGDMSLVGPRPLVVDEDCKVEGWHRRRLHLTPGMTGHWQILGSSRIPLHEMVKIDYLYIANWSLFTDVKILLRTVSHMLQRGGQ